MSKYDELTGQKIQDILVLGTCHDPNQAKKILKLRCLCFCGKEFLCNGNHLIKGIRKSCGCYKPDKIIHGQSRKGKRTRLYKTWQGIKARTHNPNSTRFHNWGGRGIEVCEEWFNSFDIFCKDMGEPPEGKYSLERIDNNKGYSKENCKWGSLLEQANNKRNNRFITVNGEKLTIAQAARKYQINYKGLYKAVINFGHDPLEAIKRLQSNGSQFKGSL